MHNYSETGGSDLIRDYSVISESIKRSRQLGEHPGAVGMRFLTPHQLISVHPSWVPSQRIKILLLYHLSSGSSQRRWTHGCSAPSRPLCKIHFS